MSLDLLAAAACSRDMPASGPVNARPLDTSSAPATKKAKTHRPAASAPMKQEAAKHDARPEGGVKVPWDINAASCQGPHSCSGPGAGGVATSAPVQPSPRSGCAPPMPTRPMHLGVAPIAPQPQPHQSGPYPQPTYMQPMCPPMPQRAMPPSSQYMPYAVPPPAHAPVYPHPMGPPPPPQQQQQQTPSMNPGVHNPHPMAHLQHTQPQMTTMHMNPYDTPPPQIYSQPVGEYPAPPAGYAHPPPPHLQPFGGRMDFPQPAPAPPPQQLAPGAPYPPPMSMPGTSAPAPMHMQYQPAPSTVQQQPPPSMPPHQQPMPGVPSTSMAPQSSSAPASTNNVFTPTSWETEQTTEDFSSLGALLSSNVARKIKTPNRPKSKYVGVSSRSDGKYKAVVVFQGQSIFIGAFAREHEAAMHYDVVAAPLGKRVNDEARAKQLCETFPRETHSIAEAVHAVDHAAVRQMAKLVCNLYQRSVCPPTN